MYTLIPQILLSLYYIAGTLLGTEEERGASKPWPPKGFEEAYKMQFCLPNPSGILARGSPKVSWALRSTIYDTATFCMVVSFLLQGKTS